MKNKVYLLGLISLMTISGCGNNQNTSSSTNNNVPSVSTVLNVEHVVDYQLDDERMYTGEMVDGLPHGQGVLTWIYTNCIYTGEFKKGLYDGEGLFEWLSNGDKLEGTFNCANNGAILLTDNTPANPFSG